MTMSGRIVKRIHNRMFLPVLPRCMIRQLRIQQLDRLTTTQSLVLYGQRLQSQNAWKVPLTAPPPTLQQAGGNSGFRKYHKK